MIWVEMKGWLVKYTQVLTTLICLAALAYPFFGIKERLSSTAAENWSLDGTVYLALDDPGERAAMDWLAKASYGVIVEAVGGSYGPAARMATHSGLPDVLGWPGHEDQWRGGRKEIGTRQEDISTLYRTRDWTQALEILQRYQVRYVVVGQLELATYRADDRSGLRALDESKFKSHLKVAFQTSGVTIYETQPPVAAVGKDLH